MDSHVPVPYLDPQVARQSFLEKRMSQLERGGRAFWCPLNFVFGWESELAPCAWVISADLEWILNCVDTFVCSFIPWYYFCCYFQICGLLPPQKLQQVMCLLTMVWLLVHLRFKPWLAIKRSSEGVACHAYDPLLLVKEKGVSQVVDRLLVAIPILLTVTANSYRVAGIPSYSICPRAFSTLHKVQRQHLLSPHHLLVSVESQTCST